MKVLFVTKQRNNSYGISVGLSNSATFVANSLRNNRIEAKVVEVVDANDIDREATLFDADLVVIEALWVTPKKMEEIISLKRHQKRVWTIRIHSKMPFLSNEGQAFGFINGYNKLQENFPNLTISANNQTFANDLGEVTNTFVDYLPNIYEPNFPPIGRVNKPPSSFLDIGCFGAIRPLKNNLQQATAAIIFSERIGRSLRFHINSSRTEQQGDQVLKNLRALFAGQDKHQLIEHPWLSHDEFVKMAHFMDIGMQVSFSESFNIVTADMVYHNVPTVVSTDVTWMPTAAQAVPTNTQDILNKLQDAYRYPNSAIRKNKKALEKYNAKAIKVWLNYLKEINGLKQISGTSTNDGDVHQRPQSRWPFGLSLSWLTRIIK
jgi:hypothetical protein